jgi:hypothetical protein
MLGYVAIEECLDGWCLKPFPLGLPGRSTISCWINPSRDLAEQLLP